MAKREPFKRRKTPGEAVLSAAIHASALISVLLLLGIVGYVFYRGFGSLDRGFFTTVTSGLKGHRRQYCQYLLYGGDYASDSDACGSGSGNLPE